MKILILGSGGREHALALKISQSSKCSKLYIAPGNAGTAECGVNVPIHVTDFEEIRTFVVELGVEMIVVGPEAPLVEGIYDFFKNDPELKNILMIAPSKAASRLEGSKDFAKAFMARYDIPTAKYQTFHPVSYSGGCEFIDKLEAPYVLKADGLAGGKGVLILDDANEAKEELRSMLIDKKFGAASKQVVIEEYLHGIELSVFVLTDGNGYRILPEAKDYKRIGEDDTGLNTGGMGSVSPVPFADKKFMKKVEERIVKPTIRGLRNEGMPYNGFVFIGLMNVKGDPFVIEYNVRFGDPEAESVIPRIKNDMVDILTKAASGKIEDINMRIDARSVATVMMVSGGYPEAYETDKVIKLPEVPEKSLVFHAGTKLDENGDVLSAGGRVIAVSSYGKNLLDSLAASYKVCKKIEFDKAYYRKDIGKDLFSRI